jgi:hypothetical protein
MYNPENKSVRSVEEIRHGLLNHPSNAHRQEELSLLIDWLIARERHNNRSGVTALRAFEEKMGNEQSASLRALTLLAEHENVDVTYKTTTPTQLFNAIVYHTPPEKQIRIDVERLESIALCPIARLLPVQNIIDVSGLMGAFEQSATRAPQTADDFIEEQDSIGRAKSSYDLIMH